MIKAPDRFVRVSAGVYRLKETTQAMTRKVPSRDVKEQNIDIRSIPYQYTERFKDVEGGGYYQIALDDVIKGTFCRKAPLKEALEKEFSNKFSKENFPCVYVLIVNPEKKIAYVGETNEALVRISQWMSRKEFTHAAIISADRITSTNIRENLERVMMESFEKIGWTLDNQRRNVRILGPEEEYHYEKLEKIMPIVANKLSCLAMNYAPKRTQRSSDNSKDTKGGSSREPSTWSGSLERANLPVRSLAKKVTNMIEWETGTVTFESAWLYFCDGEASRKRAFAALAVGRGWLDLVFLAPENATLPRGTRRLKPFVLPRKSECRLRIDSSNVDKALELAIGSLEYMRTLGK